MNTFIKQTALTKQQMLDLITRTQKRYEEIEHENYDPTTFRYRVSFTNMWKRAASDVAPQEWRESSASWRPANPITRGTTDG
jgi:hypothetical protein